MGLCLNHGNADRTYDEEAKLRELESLTTPIALKLSYFPEKEGSGPIKSSNLPPVPDKKREKLNIMAMATMNYLKTLVSKNRNRHKENGFDLDLTYITDRIIAMAYPAERVQSMFRNHLNDVYEFLEQKHKNHYYIYNLCSEKSYDKAKFCNRVKVFPFEDHNPPSFVIIKSFCEDVHSWLANHPQNVIAIHCKAGKGRTGTMICCYLLHSGKFVNADEALQFYGKKRTQDGQGVTIPSQIRYVKYYDQYLRGRLTYKPTPVFIKRVQLRPAPKFSEPVLFTLKQRTWLVRNSRNSKIGFKELAECSKRSDEPEDVTEYSKSEENYEGKYHKMDIGYKSDNINFRTSDAEVILEYPGIQTLHGDIRIELFYRSPVFTKKKRFARIWINTFFSDLNGLTTKPGDHLKYLVFKKNEIDIAWKKDKKNKLLAEDFELKLYMKVPTTKEEIEAAQEESIKKKEEGRRAVETEEDESSGAEDDTDDENDWESGKSALVAIEKSTVEGLDVPVRGRNFKTKKAHTSSPEEKSLKKPRIKKFSRSRGTPDDIIARYSGIRVPNLSDTIAIANTDSYKPAVASTSLKMAVYNTPPVSPSITSGSSCATPNISIASAAFFDAGIKKLQGTASSGSIETSTTASSSEVTCSSNSELDMRSKQISKSQSATFIYTRHDDLISAVSRVAPSSSGIHLSSSDAKVTDLKNSKIKRSFFKSLSKSFLFKK